MDATHSNEYFLNYFYSCHYSKIVLEQNVSKLCMHSFIRLTSVAAVVYIPAVSHVTLTRYSACATRHRHVTNCRNVNKSWDSLPPSDKVHTEFRHFLILSYFGILATTFK